MYHPPINSSLLLKMLPLHVRHQSNQTQATLTQTICVVNYDKKTEKSPFRTIFSPIHTNTTKYCVYGAREICFLLFHITKKHPVVTAECSLVGRKTWPNFFKCQKWHFLFSFLRRCFLSCWQFFIFLIQQSATHINNQRRYCCKQTSN